VHRTLLLTAIALIGLPTSAAAQASERFELFGGYAIVRDGNNDVVLPEGWLAGGALPLRDAIALVAEAGASGRRMDAFGADVRLRTWTAMGGLRASARVGPFTESAQLLAGLVTSSGTAFGVTDTSRALALQPGVSIDLPLGRRAAFRLQLDARFIRSGSDGNEGGHQLRASAQIVARVK
jgi:hypothetical protein